MSTFSKHTHRDLEEKITHLERHAEEQDKVIMQQTKQIEALNKHFKILATAVKSLIGHGSSSIPGDDMPPNEKPPHY